MKRLLLLLLVLLSIFLGYSFGFSEKNSITVPFSKPKAEILKIGLVADSHTENELLANALSEAKFRGVDFVIGLGDYTNLGTIKELSDAKNVFDQSGLKYFVLAGDRDGWESREKGLSNLTNFGQVFGSSEKNFVEKEIQFVLLDNSDLYKGIGAEDWESLKQTISIDDKLTFVFAHKTPFHPDSSHIMGAESSAVSQQATELVDLLEKNRVDGFFSGDIHFFAMFNSPSGSVKITTIGAVASQRNFQGPRFGILKIYDDYSWEVEDVELK